MLHNKRMEALGVHTEHMNIVLAIVVPVLPLDMLEGLQQMFNGLLVGDNLKIIALGLCLNHPTELLVHTRIPVI